MKPFPPTNPNQKPLKRALLKRLSLDYTSFLLLVIKNAFECFL
ncbi:hypothetical protein HPSA50_0448 [Helicobacter pylori SouthAfrica50]|uniref:Uncharacterized protein n=1 Tax=Helicobacter pylori SouthAfrica50 TaxID=1352357 RepID=T2SBN3_HELPX|nr:hypothetical protein HPSA50_0448 [Helicobacter pylori SouthAfrica50]